MKTLLALSLVLGMSVAAEAQTVINPAQLQFAASADHNAVITGTTTSIVTNYTVTVSTGSTQVLTTSLGKPTPDGTNTITVALSTISGFLGLPKNVLDTAIVAAVGDGGTAPSSSSSNPFVFAPVPAAPGVPVVSQ